MASETDDTSDGPEKPRFRGCVFCYSAEWLHYGAKKVLSDDGEEQATGPA